jgi:uncharacterized protein YbjT (DUF2867 family)
MSKIFAVFGATGQQGGSIVTHILNDSSLSKEYTIRAITRDLTSPQSQLLSSKVEVVIGDATNTSSLEKALKGVHTVFAMTTPSFGAGAFEIEVESGKHIADAAVKMGVQYLIFSTLPAVTQLSHGKFTKVTPFDAKAAIETYIRTLPLKSSFYSPGSFMQNFQAQGFLAPKLSTEGNGTYVMTRNVSPLTKMPLIDAVADTGKFIATILNNWEKYEGKIFAAAEALYTMHEIVDILSRFTGKRIVYQQVSTDEFKKELEFLPGGLVDIFCEAFVFGDEFGYWGKESEEQVAWAVENVEGKLVGFEEYLEKYPLVLA